MTKLAGIVPGVATTNVFEIPGSLARGDIFFVDASGNLVRLPAGTNGHFLKTQGTAGDPVWEALPGGGDMLKSTYDPNADGIFAIAQGGSGQTSAQAAIDALTQVSAATNEHVLTKDTGTGNATWKVGGGGGVTAHSALTELDYASAGHTGFAGNPADANQDMAGKMITGVGHIYGQSDSTFWTVNGGTWGNHGAEIMLCGENYTGAEGKIYLAVPNAAKTNLISVMTTDGVSDTPQVHILYGLDMNSKKIESLLAGSAAADAVRYDQVLRRANGDINSFAEKATPVNADMVLVEDSAASYAKKKVQVGNLPGSGSGQEIVASTLIVAATVANDCKDPLRADYQTDGTADHTEINAAITALPT